MVPPIGAQGLNMSLADIAALLDLCVEARATGGDIGAPELLGRYHRARHGAALARVAGIDALNRAAMAGSAAAPRPAAGGAAGAARHAAAAAGGDAARGSAERSTRVLSR